MNSLPENLTEYKQQMKQGSVPAAYRGLMEYILGLRTYFKAAFTLATWT